MPKLIIPGQREVVAAEQQADIGRFLSVTVSDSLIMDNARSDIGTVEIPNVADDDIVEFTTADGGRRWILAEDLRSELAISSTRGELDEEVILIPQALAGGEESRGFLGDLFLKGLRILKVDLGRAGAKTLATKLEKQLKPGPGLYQCPDPNDLKIRASKRRLSGSKPILLFIHGTASSTAGSFGALTESKNSKTWRKLTEIYTDRIVAFEHLTLSKSPIDNAIELMEALPSKAVLHIVSHSRGGLIGELLARGFAHVQQDQSGDVFGKREIKIFKKAQKGNNRYADIQGLKKLNKLFDSKKISIGQFVRVACPAAGTTLASRRLDRYLTVIVNILGRIPMPGLSQVFDLTTSLLMAVVKKRTDPEELPGLEAQMPGSPLIRMLNDPTKRIDTPLTVISGDIKGGGLLGSLKVFAADLFFRDDHDLVVNTPSMYGGTPRENAAYFFDQGKEVDHFHYFTNPKTQKALETALTGETGEGPDFQSISPRNEQKAIQLASSRSHTNKPIVVIIPGMMGSHLEAENKAVWLDSTQIAQGVLSEIQIENPKVSAKGLLSSTYADLIEFLQETHEVIPFAYDWRKSLKLAADDLASLIQEKSAASDQSIRLLAHSTGGCVVQLMIHLHSEIWKNLTTRKGGRLLLLGAPQSGTYAALQLLTGQDNIIEMLTMLDPDRASVDILDFFWRFPGLFELLPHDPGQNFYAKSFWQKIKKHIGDNINAPDKELLEAAAAVNKQLRKFNLDPLHTVYVAGKATETAVGFRWAGDGSKGPEFLASPAGDGYVDWKSGIPLELVANTWYMEVEHGRLAAHSPGFSAILELLESGTTSRLQQKAPTSRTTRGSLIFEAVQVNVFPGAAELESAATGMIPRYHEMALASTDPVKVYVSHGNLENAHFPVAVGHHKGDGIVSAEKALNYYLKNRLVDRHQMGVYPGEIETAEVILQAGAHPPGGIVVGLGEFGELNTGKLERSFSHAVMVLALQQREASLHETQASDTADADKPEPLGVSTLLIGSGFGGLTLRGTIRSLLTGVKRANQRIRMLDTKGLRPIEEVEIIEIYETRAIQAMRVIKSILLEQPFEQFSISQPYVRKVAGGRRQLLDEEGVDWWHRFKVEGKQKTPDGSTQTSDSIRPLRFTALTDRARAEESNLPTQRAIVDALIEQSVGQSGRDLALARAMFELLIPNAFKDYASDRKNILWIVDAASAAYPWELLHDPSRGETAPVAIRAGMLRQLTVTNFRSQVQVALEKKALVIGDPKSNLLELQAAQDEANLVGNKLEGQNYEVKKVVRGNSAEIIKALFLHNYQLIHLAGHGVVEYTSDKHTGMVLGGDTYLTPAVINQMRIVPDFVFINCCHLGKSNPESEVLEQDRHKLAANLGTQLISMGVRAVIAAGWAVQDDAAKTFSETFYEKFLNGEKFGESVRLARQVTYETHPNTNTWGAYQCYGDPYYSLKRGGEKSHNEPAPYVDPLEVLIDLENIINDAESASNRWMKTLRRRLLEVRRRLPEVWLSEGKVIEGLAIAHAELDMFKEAVELYEKSLRLEKATYSMKTLEQLANLKAHWAVKCHAEPDLQSESTRTSKELINEAIGQLKLVLQFGETTERWNLLGSAYKRQAIVEHAATPCLKALKASEKAYSRGQELAGIDSRDLYARINQETTRAVIAYYEGDSLSHDPELASYLDQRLEQLAIENRKNPSFWHLTFPANIYELRLLREGSAKESHYKPLIIDCYRQAWQYGGSYKKRGTVLKQYEFLIHMMTTPTSWPVSMKGKNRKALDQEMRGLKHVFEGLREALKEIMGPED